MLNKKSNKYVEISCSSIFYFDHVSNKVSLGAFLAWIKNYTKHNARDVTLSLAEDFIDDGDTVICQGIKLEWKRKIKSPEKKKSIKRKKNKS